MLVKWLKMHGWRRLPQESINNPILMNATLADNLESRYLLSSSSKAYREPLIYRQYCVLKMEKIGSVSYTHLTLPTILRV